MEKYDSIPSPGADLANRDFWTFKIWVLASQAIGLAAVVLTAVWMGHYHGGFAWQENPAVQFNYHPLFMVIGLVFLYSNSIISYRVFRHQNKVYIKLLHAALHILALVFAGVGLKAVFDSHNLVVPPVANMYSLHSWVGLSTVILFAFQWFVGLVTFLLPGFSQELRAMYKPVHVFWGIVVFFMAIATCLLGITEKEFFSNGKYSSKNAEGILANCLGLTLLLLAGVVGYLVTNPAYQRQQIPDDEQVQLTH
ncbi:hypothetical protein CAPTEDRAFT_167574 [Capitella teleta]|uniref:Cytochrome b561 domain-containing protein n=1 Tax=Capitella teleta TaxID=283909 RepID=X1ZB36_CAPTE|nr:hypothetical protein CAPTEDRAFT_167574 [Capitella teleta]|eukprot:ELU10148.1 hypothetical protein CAPTEDRAFT_167574 [Capitella teleta]